MKGSCFFGEFCVETGTYIKKVTLKNSNTGYYLSFVRCCRDESYNTQIGDGMSLIAFIPPTNYKNNSPIFSMEPKIRNNVGDTIEELGATDKDGDSLIYSFVTPFSGGSKIDPYPDPLLNMVDTGLLKYNSGYSYLKPFGTDGTISINPKTGKLIYINNVSGLYTFCIEIKEYRKGILIGIHRRDYPLIFYYKPIKEEEIKIRLLRPEFVTNRSVALSWDICSEDSQEYTIEHKQKSTNWEVRGITKSHINFIDSISNNIMYYFRIKAKINSVEIVSNIDSAILILTTLRSLKVTEINFYPNPAKDYLYFKYAFAISCGIYNSIGNLMLESNEINKVNETQLDIRSLPPGFYSLVINTNKGFVVERFVKE